mmetsp:Transcript_3013/g.2898  ORF Transcript_3013/g.2898 Transcript_3013/m.2898 type:complete len:127 (-) Transcript_3013:801-1181(-)|eukprot:CAMPEP_0197828516 /NCGR_PEP_ID=MMETSP1437-20131217/5058_1 /TAXON_ID=49252 ORGANISM="Eucampia antarctica, Strain CCMP1452" /NCGR_SAMPLE_ID=MMETSP1437 /ASSEMBLY_ACC=CAM_ASM_001096 /LENGTH=126 /DNA_ID=CAMNT_0043429743 /DNA_START=1003 /DNA_END=1383 /DNA_ORIENTATION=+
MISESKKPSVRILDEDLDMLMPRNDAVDDFLHALSATTEELSSVNSADDTPYFTKIGDHTFKSNRAIKFRCHDIDDKNERWCKYQKAVTNIGHNFFQSYVKNKNLKKRQYEPKQEATLSKMNVKIS